MDNVLLNSNPLLTPGQRLLRAKGFEAAEKYPFPRDCEAVIFDEDEDVFYLKFTDVNGAVTVRMFDYTERPIPKFDPTKYVTVDDFKSFKEEILNGFNNLQQTIAANGNRNAQQGNNRGDRKQNNAVGESSGNIQ